MFRVLVCCLSLLLLVFSCYLYTMCVLCTPFSSTFNIFALFTYQKKTYLKTKRINLRFCRISKVALEKKKWCHLQIVKKDTLVLPLRTMKPSTRPLCSTLIIILLRTSTTMVKRKSERGSPCLKPLVALTQPSAFLLTKTTKLVEEK